MIDSNISRQVLTIGCDYRNTKGGISSVLDSYSQIYKPFNFIATTQTKSKLHNLLYLLSSLIRFSIRCCSKEIKIIHIHTASNNSFWRKALYIKIAHFFNKKVVLHIHGGTFHIFYEQNKASIEKVLKKVDIVIALSEKWKSFFTDTVGCKNVKVVPNITDMPKKLHKEEYRGNKTISALFLGFFSEGKGIYDILEMAKRHKEYLSNRLCISVGGNGETEKVKKIIDEHKLDDIIKLEGWVDKEKKTTLLLNADLFLLPSYNEGLPISILEAMSYSLPVVSTNVGGIPEIIKNGVNGNLIEPGNIDALFNAIKVFIEDKEYREQCGYNAFKSVEPHLPDKVSKALHDLYKEEL